MERKEEICMMVLNGVFGAIKGIKEAVMSMEKADEIKEEKKVNISLNGGEYSSEKFDEMLKKGESRLRDRGYSTGFLDAIGKSVKRFITEI